MGEKRTVSNKVAIGAVCAALVLFALGLWYRIEPETPKNSQTPPTAVPRASLKVEVMDAVTNAPLSGAVVVIAETGKSYTTNAQGATEPILLPEGGHNATLQKPWSEASVLIYKEGYVPYAIFHAKSTEEVRSGPRVYLFPEQSVQNAQPFSVTEGPPREWVNELVERFKP